MTLAVVSAPFLHLPLLELVTNMTALSVPLGIVATSKAFRGISAFVD